MKRFISKTLTGTRFVALFLAVSALVLLLMGALMRWHDPWLYYGIDEDRDYWLDGTFVSAGLIKNMEYDAAVVGPSLFQDFRMQWFRDYLDVEPINLTMPGLDNNETPLLIDALLKRGTVQQIYISMTPNSFQKNLDKGRIPTYLLDESVWNDYRYLYSYEAWTKFLPLNAATWMTNVAGLPVLDRYASMRDTDALGNELNRYSFSSETAFRSISSAQYIRLSESQKDVMLEIMTENFDQYIASFRFEESADIKYYFILPPHSALYWQIARYQGRDEVIAAFQAYVAQRLGAYENVFLVDCQTMEEIADLDHYRDSIHFDLVVQEGIVARLAEGTHLLTESDCYAQQIRLFELVDRFCEENKGILKDRGLM